ncbi:hypothetical protein ANCDUO_09392 [Ancylostoma duodenale]|uniref:DDE Tnp4 domain-containing protein n=1 Tax=Ancylostoma duodenale TaxID=51022 RepID=A0A0C2GGT2_9BILA|nr:hypothetical protein ANCDUO_09392 [Ancylostoma duodenale]
MFEECASKTQSLYDHQRAVAFLDGKHARIEKTAHSGSLCRNYKQLYSIILPAMCDVDYRIIAYHIGASGRAGDAGVFRSTSIEVGIAMLNK